MNTRVAMVAAVLLGTILMRAALNVPAEAPQRTNLAGFPQTLGEWRMEHQQSISEPLMGVLKPDDYLLRRYHDRQGREADLFIAYYRVQHAGETMHSPKNCLPGWGWQPLQNDVVDMQRGGQTVKVNRYVVEKNGQRALVLYWYQTHGRVIASEYTGKIFLVWDALRYGRRDGGLVRVMVPVDPNQAPGSDLRSALELSQAASPYLDRYLPN